MKAKQSIFAVRRPHGGRYSWRKVYPLCGRWRWHVHMEVRRVPPRTYANRAGWSRWWALAHMRAAWAWVALEARQAALLGKEKV